MHAVATDVAGPMLCGFVLWILLEARRQGIERLYFLARDGQVTLKIAECLRRWAGFAIDCRYLYVSRQSLRLPSLVEIDDDALTWLAGDTQGKSLRTILERVELVPEENAAELERLGFTAKNWDQPIGVEERVHLGQLFADRNFANSLLTAAEKRRAALLTYLKQEGFADQTRSAIVDLGWYGRLQVCLTRVLKEDSNCSRQLPLLGFYLALLERPVGVGTLLCYNRRTPNPSLVEELAIADHAFVRCFEIEDSGRAVPVLAPDRITGADLRRSEIQQKGVMAFVETLVSALRAGDLPLDTLRDFLRERGRQAFDLFSHFPTPEEAITYGRVYHAIDQAHRDGIELAPVLKGRDLFDEFSNRSRNFGSVLWVQGAIIRSVSSEPLSRGLLLLYDAVRRIRRPLFRPV